MDNITLENYKFELIPMGIMSSETKLVLTIRTELKLDELKEIFKSENNTKCITLVSGGAEKEYSNYIVFRSITDNDDGTFTIVLEKKNVNIIIQEMQEKIDVLEKELKQNNQVIDQLVISSL